METNTLSIPSDIQKIFAAILDAVQAAERLPVHTHVGSFNHMLMDQLLQNIGDLARAGYAIAIQMPLMEEEHDPQV